MAIGPIPEGCVAQLSYPESWELEYLQTGRVAEWPDFVRGRKPLGLLGGFAQYALQHLLRLDGISSITWLYIASVDKAARERLRGGELDQDSVFPSRRLAEFQCVVSHWQTMRAHIGASCFAALQLALIEQGFNGYRGEPDLFCFRPDGSWFFAEAKRIGPKRSDHLGDSQLKWFAIAEDVLGADHSLRLYCVKPSLCAPSDARSL